jgi:chromosome segregation ATPase
METNEKNIAPGTLPFIEHSAVKHYQDILDELAKESLNISIKLYGLEKRLSSNTARRTRAEENVRRIIAVLPETNAAMQSLLQVEKQKLELKLNHYPTYHIEELTKQVEALKQRHQQIETHFNSLIPAYEENLERWKKINAMNEGNYTPAMYRKIFSYEAKNGSISHPEVYKLPRM